MANPDVPISARQRLIDLLPEYESQLENATVFYLELVSIVPDRNSANRITEIRGYLEKLAQKMEQKASEISDLLMTTYHESASLTPREREEAETRFKKVQKTLEIMQV